MRSEEAARPNLAGDAGAAPSEPTLDRAIQARIGDRLRAMYDTLLEQPVPDRFASLLDQMDKPDHGDT